MAEAATPPAGSPAPHAEERASATDWIAVAAGSLGALMATLDISLTNSALPQIQGEIGATGTEGTWISTGYLMSEIVMIPLAAWLTRVFRLRNFLLVSAVLFIVFSMMCGWSNTLALMIVGRIGQGFTGGAMIPTAQTIIRTRLPTSQLPVGMTLFGLIVLLGPLFGPVLGGWLAENVSWSWCFFINLPVCLILIALLVLGLPSDKPQWPQFFSADWVGIAGLSIGLSSLTVVLEEGQRERWFESSMIVSLSWVTFAGFVLIAISQFTAKRPMLRLSLMRNPRYASVIVIVAAVGAGLYGISYLLPQFLAIVSGYNAEQAGEIMLLSGLPAFLMMPPILPKAARQGRLPRARDHRAAAVLPQLHARHLADGAERRPRFRLVAADPGRRADAAEPGLDGHRLARGIGRRGRALQHGPHPRQLDRPGDHRHRHRPPHHL
ncbi:MAG: Multidrug export protein EmrB [Burkholderia gladioli]|nr:MAG: Multidrug export protein EmrB [Burkholderia gladioli]